MTGVKQSQDEPGRNSPEMLQPTDNRVSMKWLTLESLRILHSRLAARELTAKVLLLTASGPVQGYLSDISADYETSVQSDRVADIDIASATVHLRTELLRVQQTSEKPLNAVDNGAIIHLKQAVIRMGARRVHLEHLALFADAVTGYGLVSNDVL